MLSFELSVIDVVLSIAVIVLSILYVTKPRSEQSPGIDKKIISKKPAKTVPLKNDTVESSSVRPPESPRHCSHHFGYLKTQEREKPIPNECMTCSMIVDCLYASE